MIKNKQKALNLKEDEIKGDKFENRIAGYFSPLFLPIKGFTLNRDFY